ncbi:hypothetical protein ACMFMF_008688 [Clarireedia jacksonii]
MVNVPAIFQRFQQSPANHQNSPNLSFSSAASTSTLDPPTPIPIHEKPTVPRQQILSPFYSGILPAELRTLIFEYALTPSPHPTLPAFSPNTAACRPGTTHPLQIHTALLSTCRRIYHETHHLPAQLFPHRFFCFREPEGLSAELLCRPDAYFARLTPWQQRLVKRVTLHTQLFWLEDSFPRVAGREYLQGLEELRIVVRRGDWWWNERNARLAITPYGGSGQEVQRMENLMKMAVEERKWGERGWGAAFQKLSRLRVLEMEFETSEDKRAELERLVEWARSWEFPMGERGVLSMRKGKGMMRDRRDVGPVEYEEVKSWEWRGKAVHWRSTAPGEVQREE